MQAGLPHRTRCRPLIIHLAPKASTDQLSLRSATQNRWHEGRPATIDPMPVPLQRAAVSVRPVNMSTTWPVHDRLTMAACPMIRPCLQRMRFSGAATSCDVSSRTIRTSEAENIFTSCPPGLDRPSSKLSMSICFLPHDWLHNNWAAAAAETRTAEQSRAPTSRSDAPSTSR